MKKGNPARRKRAKEARRLARRAEEKAAFDRSVRYLAERSKGHAPPVIVAPDMAPKTSLLEPYQQQAVDRLLIPPVVREPSEVKLTVEKRRKLSPTAAAVLLAFASLPGAKR